MTSASKGSSHAFLRVGNNPFSRFKRNVALSWHTGGAGSGGESYGERSCLCILTLVASRIAMARTEVLRQSSDDQLLKCDKRQTDVRLSPSARFARISRVAWMALSVFRAAIAAPLDTIFYSLTPCCTLPWSPLLCYEPTRLSLRMRDTSSDLAKTALGTVRGEAEASEVPLHMPPCDVATTSPHGSLAAVNCLLSDEIILRIWQYLGATELARLQCVCRRFNSLAADPQVSGSMCGCGAMTSSR